MTCEGEPSQVIMLLLLQIKEKCVDRDGQDKEAHSDDFGHLRQEHLPGLGSTLKSEAITLTGNGAGILSFALLKHYNDNDKNSGKQQKNRADPLQSIHSFFTSGGDKTLLPNIITHSAGFCKSFFQNNEEEILRVFPGNLSKNGCFCIVADY